MTRMDYDGNTTKHNSDLTLKENKSSCYFKNPSKVTLNKLKVDGGLINSSNHEKCDYIVHWNDCYVIYIELKGGDLIKAFSQIENTIKMTYSQFNSFKNSQCIIVCSRMRLPKNDSTMMKLKKKMKVLTGNVPIIKSQRHDYIVKAD